MSSASPVPFLYVCRNCDLVVGDEQRLPPVLNRCPRCGSQHCFERVDGPHAPLPVAVFEPEREATWIPPYVTRSRTAALAEIVIWIVALAGLAALGRG